MREGLEDIISKLNEFENYKYAEFPPSAVVAIFRINEDRVKYYALADCSLLFAMKSGEIKIVSTNDIREIDERNMQLIVNTAKERNISTLEAKALPHIRKVFVEMFKNRNTPTGGWVLSNDFESLLHANTGELRLSEIKSILGFSDGFSQIYELFKHLSPEQLADRVHGGEKLEALYEELYRLQQQDESCNNYQLTKLRDDASAIKLIIAK